MVSDWMPTTGTGDILTQMKVRTDSITTITTRDDTRTCAVTINGEQDEPPLDCADAETTRTVEVDTDTTEEQVIVETRTIDNATDTAAWMNTGTAVVVADKTILTRTFNNDDALSFKTGGSIDFLVTADETFDLAAGTSTQQQTCTLTVNGYADKPPPTCPDGSAIDATRPQTSDTQPMPNQSDDAVSYAFTNLSNPLSYTDAEIANDEFANSSVTGGYDIVNIDTPDERFLITNEGTGRLFTGINTTPNYFWWYDNNGNDTLDLSFDLIVYRPSATEYATIDNAHEEDVKNAHIAGWNGECCRAIVPPLTLFSQSNRNRLTQVAPGMTHAIDSNNGQNLSLFVGPRNINAIGQGVQVTPCDSASLVCSASATGSQTTLLTVASNTSVLTAGESTDIVDDVVVVAGLVGLLMHKYDGLSYEQINAIILSTRGANKALQVAEALSPVGKLR